MPKQITTVSRLTNQMERIVRALIHDFFDDAMPMPIVTAIPCTRSYAHFSIGEIWHISDGETKHEINISTAYLDRPLEALVSSLLHELCHYYGETVLRVQTASRGGMYHPRAFKEIAESHGLICTKTNKYGFSDTSSVLSDTLLDWCLLHDEFLEIQLCRDTPGTTAPGIGSRAANGGAPITGTVKTSSIRWHCPGCGAIVRSTRAVNIVCGDCLAPFIAG